MNSNTIFTVRNDDLGRLDERTAVDFFQRLLWAEARRIGIEISKINVSSRIHVPDGGVDATVDEVQIATGSGIIKPGKTSYQIKAGAAFKPWRKKSVIKKELFGAKEPERGNLGRSIRDCLDDGGTYVLVCTGIDLVEPQRTDALNHIKNYLKQCGYQQSKVEVWSQSTLRGFLEVFPSLALWITRRSGAEFQTHQSWSQNEDMQNQFVSGQLQDELIEKIQNELWRNDDTVHVRVLGEPGIGKTKLVLEATKADDLSPLVIYSPASQFRDSNLMNTLRGEDNQFSVVLVIDECDPENRSYIWNTFRHQGPRIKLITIYNNYDPISDINVAEFEALRLSDDQINTIIQKYGVSKEQANRYLQFCDGSPRMAHHTGKVLSNYPGDPSQLLTDDYLYKSFYIDLGRENPDSQEVKERQRVLRHIALFMRFGYERYSVREAKAIAQKAGIEWTEFQEIVNNLKNRKVLQGEFTLYITPKALHIKLWIEWWRVYGSSFDFEKFTQELAPKAPKLVEWFYEMFQYAAESDAASRIVEDLLGPNGPFQGDENLKTRLGSRFFSVLTEANPKSALKCLMRTIGTWDRDTLLHFTEGRRNVIWALEKIAMWEDLFGDAAELLLALGEAENEGWPNNASGVFAALFSPGHGRVAPTEAPPAVRFPVLKEAFESGSKERRALGLKACRAALQSRHFSRIGSAEYQGLRPEPKLWMPKTYGEIYDAYRRVWLLLVSQLERLPEDERKVGIEILFGHVRGLARIPNLAEMVADTVSMIIEKMYVSEKQVIATITQLLNYEGKELLEATRQRWEQLRDELVKPDFHSMMQRYVGMDLLEDKFDENRNHVDQAQPWIEKLAQQAVDTPSLLQSELYWLVTTEAKKGYQFGHELGKRDDGFALLPTLLDAQRNAGENACVYFLGGYFRAIFDSNVAEWEKQLDALVADTILNIAIPELTNGSSMTDRAGWRILKLAKSGIINVNHFGIFDYFKVIESLSNEVFTAWIEFLLEATEKSAVSIVLHLYERYYTFPKLKPTLPRDLTFRILSHPSLFEESDGSRFGTMTDHYWTEIGKAFVNLHPEKSLELVEPILSHFGQEGAIIDIYSETCSVLDQITQRYPVEVWEQVCKHLEDQTNFSRAFSLERWLRGREDSPSGESAGALTLIPREKIWEWVDEDAKNRAWHLASRLLPKTLSVVGWQESLARAVLIRYGEQEEVRSSLRSNYLTEGWWGPGSLHYKEKQQQLLRLKEGEDNENVKRWIDEFVDGLEEAIVHEKIEEERRF